MHVLVTAASRHGATAEIAQALAAGLSERGEDAVAIPIEQVDDLDGYDAVVLGSAIYMGRWMKPARQFVASHAATGARDHRLFAGRLDRSALGLSEGAAVRAVRAPETDSRDWEAIEAYASEIAGELA